MNDKQLRNDNSNLSKFDKRRDRKMDSTRYAQELMRDAYPKWFYGSVDAIVFEASEFMSGRLKKRVTPRRMRSIWEGKARRIDADERDALEEAKLEGLRKSQAELRSRLASIDEALAEINKVEAGR